MSLEPRSTDTSLAPRSSSGSFPAPPIHALAALATVALDGVFAVPELAVLSLPITVVTVGALGFASTALVQRFLAKDDWGASLAKGLVMGIVAGVPYPVAGTLVGVPLLAWSGLQQLRQWSSGNNHLVDEALRNQRALEEKNEQK